MPNALSSSSACVAISCGPPCGVWTFYADDPLNSKVGDEMGVVISTSHHEPMARNHQEWSRHRKEYGAWNYVTNQKINSRSLILQRRHPPHERYGRCGAPIGMRGDGDGPMSEDADTKLLERIIRNQRKIIARETGRPAEETPQVWALYKEVQDYYDKGLRVPDDVIMLLADDNWGNVRRLPNAEERETPRWLGQCTTMWKSLWELRVTPSGSTLPQSKICGNSSASPMSMV